MPQRSNICVTGRPKRRKDNRTVLEEIAAENIPNLEKDINPQIQEGEQTQTG